jgi:hypothetical protein
MEPTSPSTRERELSQRILELEAELADAHEKIAFWESHATLASGVAGESLIADLVNGTTTAHNDSEDVIVGDTKIEVKMAKLNVAVKGRKTSSKRWAWAQILGVGNQKQFDRLILIGKKDSRFADQYMDPSSPYVIFDLPYADLVPDTYGLLMNTGRYYSIQLTTNPSTVRGPGKRRLYEHYQCTASDIQARYGL